MLPPSYWALLRIPNVRGLAMSQFLTNLILYSTVVVAFQASRGLSYTDMFLLESVMSGAAFLLEVPTGVLGDKLGHRRMLILGQTLYLASFVLFALAQGFWLFALSSALYGAGLAANSGCDSALLYESLPAEQREAWSTPAFSLLGSASSAGFFCGLVLGSFLGAGDPALPVFLNIGPIALALVATLRLRAPAAGHRAEATIPAGQLLRQAWSLVTSRPVLVGLSLLGSASFALLNAIFWYNQPLLDRAAVPVAWFGPITAAAMGLQALAALAAPGAQRRLGLGGALALSLVVPGVAYVLAAWAQWPWAASFAVAAVVAGGAWRAPLLRGELNRRIPSAGRATTLSALSLLGTLAGFAINPLIGHAGDRGLVAACLTLGPGLMLLAVPAVLLIRRSRRESAET